MQNITEYLHRHSLDIIEDIKQLVSAESPSNHKDAVDRCGEVLQTIFKLRLDATVDIHHQHKYGNQLKFTVGSQGEKTIILGHFDTVWNIGELRLYEADGKFYGPGILDMKAGLIQAIWAVRALKYFGQLEDKQIIFLCNSDEELGSPSSKDWLNLNAQGATQVLVVEPAVANTGALKIARKGSGRYQIKITGIAAHAGNNPEEGISAIQEMAHQILSLHALNAPELGTTVNVGIAHGGGRVNVVADYAELGIDTRVTCENEAIRIDQAIHQLSAVTTGIKLEISGTQTRPPMQITQNSEHLFSKAQSIARKLGFSLEAKTVGGGSDGNFTAALGLPTLDGLGATGSGIHARHEHILVANIVPRTALLAGMILEQNADKGETSCLI
ncbi:peptidase M20 [Acinetobacter sp. ANC 4558]|uniref:M20 family metallopeptidase n=1 Tax=Acinetobacter sp. ANC 4558 TaxID=1977876 RepID=UPI000A3395C5|nr:M20 family metallopeptidase [Acinetobacter sp. ANC 4558]OTG85366.1 peptidase M20 [Acinetobacter sp. ANC 4558]